MLSKFRVWRAARLLDLHDPAWYTRINTRTLNLRNNHDCVIGQAFGEYHTSSKAKAARKAVSFRAGLALFTGPLTPSPFFAFLPWKMRTLHNAWVCEINKRKAKDKEAITSRYEMIP